MSPVETLRRRYRRLLWAYPRWHRRERGLEMLTTLLDGAEPGRRWPHRADVADVLRRGLACRFRVPRGPLMRGLAVLTIFFAGLVGTTVVAQATAAAVVPQPTEAEAVAAVRTALDQTPRNLAGPAVPCYNGCYEPWIEGGDQVATFDVPFSENGGMDHVTVVFFGPLNRVQDTVTQARARLVADGWEVDGITSHPLWWSFRAVKAGLWLKVVGNRDTSLPQITIRVDRKLPPVVAWAGVAGFLAGLLVGWMLTVGTLQRLRRHGPVVRVVSVLSAVPGLLVMLMLDTHVLTYVFLGFLNGAPAPQMVPLLPLVPAFVISDLMFSPVVVAIVAALVLITPGLAALPLRSSTRDTTDPTRSSPGRWSPG